MESTLIQSHTYIINLSNVAYFRPRYGFEGKGETGTNFFMTNGKVVTITCPCKQVVEQLGKRMPTHHIIKLDY